MEPLRDLFVQCLLLFEGASLIQGDLDHDKAVRALNTEIIGIIDQAVVIVLCDHLKMVIRRNIDGGKHCLVDDFPNLLAEVRRFPFHKRDANKWHCSTFLSRRSFLLKLHAESQENAVSPSMKEAHRNMRGCVVVLPGVASLWQALYVSTLQLKLWRQPGDKSIKPLHIAEHWPMTEADERRA